MLFRFVFRRSWCCRDDLPFGPGEGDAINKTETHALFGGEPMSQSIVDEVQARYAAVAESKLSSAQEGVRAIAEAFGYSPEELASIPADANMGLSCGNPTATANLKPGEVVVDL